MDAAEDEAARFLDLAGYADGLLDADDSERVAAVLAGDAGAAADVAVARELAGTAGDPSVARERIIERASALVRSAEPERGHVIPLGFRARRLPSLQGLARWGSVAAAVALASWLGFAMGSDASLALTSSDQASEDGFLHEILEPSSGFLRDLTEGTQT